MAKTAPKWRWNYFQRIANPHLVIAVLLNSDYNRDDEREYFPNVMEALNTSWLLLLTFLNLTPERGSIRFLGHTDGDDKHSHNRSLPVTSLYVSSQTSDQRESREACGERRRRGRIFLQRGSREARA